MKKANEIRRHIYAVEETRKITNAMQLVATSRLRRVMMHIEYNQKYFERIWATMKDILSESYDISHPYLTKREGDRVTYIVIAGDKGLAGSYNSDVLHLAMNKLSEKAGDKSLITVGLVAGDFFRRQGIEPDIELMGTIQDPSLSNAREIAFDIIDMYDRNLTDEVNIVYTSFFGETKYKPVTQRLLPLIGSDYDLNSSPHSGTMSYEPSPELLFEHLVPQFIVGVVFGSLVQSYASEHYARMNAMQNATRNADEMLDVLKMNYNLARQTAITQEITEITGSIEVLLNGDEESAKQF